jgi:hypothetical protein
MFVLILGAQLKAQTNVSVSLGNTQNIDHGIASEKINTTDLEVAVKSQLKKISFQVVASGSAQNNHQGEASLANTLFSVQENPKSLFNSETSSAVGLSVTLPTDSELRDTTRFQGGFGVFHALVSNTSVLSSPLSILWRLGIAKNFHEFDLGNEGQALTEYSVKNRLGLTSSLTSHLQLQISLDYINGLTYRKAAREKFSSSAQVSYAFTDLVSANFGVSTEGNAKKANELDSNVSFFNENTSMIQSGISLEF